MPKLSKRVVDAAAPREKQFTIWDSDLKGFGLYIHPSGQRSYFVDYRAGNGKRRRMTLGRANTLTPDQARSLAMNALASIALEDEDPLVEKRTRRKSLTVAQLCDQYISAARKGLVLGRGGRAKKASTLITDESRIEAHIKPLLGGRLVVDVSRAEVTRAMRDMIEGKTAKVTITGRPRGKSVVTGGAGAASRTIGLLGGIFSYAVSEGIIEANPVTGIKKPATASKDRRLSPDEYRALGRALEACADTEVWQAITGIKLLALTGFRLSEVTAARREWFDDAAQIAVLGDTKTGRSVRPLGQAAVAQLPKAAVTPWLLPSPRKESKNPYGGLEGAIERITKRAKLEGVTAHTLRHSFASVAGDLGYADSTTGAILGHAGHGVTSRYVHRLDAVLIAAADAVATEVSRQMMETLD